MGAGAIRIGIAGWSYADWKGVVYPSGCRDTLRAVAGLVDLVEVNSTFYRTPKPEVVASWVEHAELAGVTTVARLSCCMELDGARVIAKIRRGEVRTGRAKKAHDLTRRVGRGIPAWLVHPVSIMVVMTFLGAPFVTGKTWWWWIVFALALIQQVALHLSRWATDGARFEQVRHDLERSLGVIKRRVLPNTTCRLTILIPRQGTADGETELVPVIRSDGIPTRNSRILKVVRTNHELCEGVCGRVFVNDAGPIERAGEPDDPSYTETMFVDKPFVQAGEEHRDHRRNPRYVLGIFLRFHNSRLGVLAIDHDQAMHLNPTTEASPGVRWDDLTDAPRRRHELRRKNLEAIAEVMPRLALAPLYKYAGVEV